MALLTHTELLEMWKADSQISPTRIKQDMFALPILHSKYLEILTSYKVAMRKQHLKLNKIRLLKTRYYNGELDKEELDANGWKQYQRNKPLKSELESILSADPDIQEILEQQEYLEIMISAGESILKEINQRGFLFKNIVQWEIFQAGGV